ncbi:kinesin-like protein KIF14 [Ambystoma mexicanum]|uniref:kinesin-like protein KIF14 n=1 Tax=Ambystoma mexicanum TaxID=8296 RepID=UPI0037E7FA3C
MNTVSSLRGNSPFHIHSKSDRFAKQPNLDGLEVDKSARPVRTLNKTKDINRTYVISALTNSEDSLARPKQDVRLTLQRRKTTIKDPPGDSKESNENAAQDNKKTEVRLTLKRRTNTVSLEKVQATSNSASIPSEQLQHGIKSFPTAVASKSHHSDVVPQTQTDPTSNVVVSHCNGLGGIGSPILLKGNSGVDRAEIQTTIPATEQSNVVKPEKRILDLKPKECDQFQKTAKVASKTPERKCWSMEKPRTPKSLERVSSLSKYCMAPDNRNSASSTNPRCRLDLLQAIPKKKMCVTNPFQGNRNKCIQEQTIVTRPLPLSQESAAQNTRMEEDVPQVENSTITVAVRVRPFNNREKSENTFQVVFMNGQETIVQHPGTKQAHTFLYDFSFWSFEESHPNFASQEVVYEALAVPLLERAFEGYNACLFAYGQTGSGKSYTMMGFGEEQGIIPRFCNNLFSRIKRTTPLQISHHLEMSYFEIYNEKIHDLLVLTTENGQKKQPLRVRENPVFGPYVEDLSTNVVTSYSDIQSWLELGNKQRATAATGMNDKSSRSHSVCTIIMTQTKTEFVEGEEHEHRVTSRINLVDLAGSERCSTAQTTGERLKEGLSINKSLFTLGKVISALSEHSQTKRRGFIPYRDSVLTWLLKDSLGGNSKTAMIATISPAASNLEESLSTLRYAKQARMIINVAKVNEDMNAKLIRELKAEIAKLKASPMNTPNINPEKYRHCKQEIASLKVLLSQQMLEMADMQRAWKEKLEQAERRKIEETKELQKAGIAFKMDNRLPNLVNLNEDPQLSEMLLYMIKEGQTTVGKLNSSSSHDIQLSGVLIADDHCVISNCDGSVSITPLGEAKTYVNGRHILEPTVLQHGDRVILGGDHYFRFNHPVEVQRGKRASCGSVLSCEGTKDFEFAKNELLAAQRSQLEAEIEEACLKAKEEMMQGIQIAKEMAQQDLTDQRTVYENKIKALEAQLKEESERKQLEKRNNQKATHKIQELEMMKHRLEQEVQMNKRRLEMETQSTRQAFEDHTVRHAKILEALEAEKLKIAKEVEALQQERSNKNKPSTTTPNWNSMKLSMMIKEANTISSKLRKETVFNRHDISLKENVTGPAVQVQVRNVKLGISTFWSLEKFEYKLAQMKELYESNDNKDDDVFYDPADEWEPDLTTSSDATFSRRRSRSLMKNRRISGCLYEIRVHPIQSLQGSHASGMMNTSSSFLSKSSSSCSSPPESFLPTICKEIISLSLDFLGQGHAEERSVADSLMLNLLTIHNGVTAISNAYETQDDNSQENFFSSDRATQCFSIRMTSAFEQLVILSKHWLGRFQQFVDSPKIDELQHDVKKLGGYLQLLLQGCSSDISSMVREAQERAFQTVEHAIINVGYVSAFTGTELHLSEEITNPEKCYLNAIYEGIGSGLENLLDMTLMKTKEMEKELLSQFASSEALRRTKNDAVALGKFLQNSIYEYTKVDIKAGLKEQDSGSHDLKKIAILGKELLKLNHAIDQACQICVSVFKGMDWDANHFTSCLDNISNSTRLINKCYNSFTVSIGHSITRNAFCETNDLDELIKSLVKNVHPEREISVSKAENSYVQPKSIGQQSGTDVCASKYQKKGVPKVVFKLAPQTDSSMELSPSEIHWV